MPDPVFGVFNPGEPGDPWVMVGILISLQDISIEAAVNKGLMAPMPQISAVGVGGERILKAAKTAVRKYALKRNFRVR